MRCAERSELPTIPEVRNLKADLPAPQNSPNHHLGVALNASGRHHSTAFSETVASKIHNYVYLKDETKTNSIDSQGSSLVSSLTVRHSSLSVILARPAKGDSYEILLVERMARDGSQFLNAHVFPGGQVEASDGGNIRRSALRELYEEASLYLRPSSHPHLITPETVEVNTSQTSYPQFLQSTSSESAESALIPYSRWITPNMMPKRFDTTFFLALSTPKDHPAAGKVDGQEIKSLAWFTPSDALTQFSDGKITLFPPQWYILSDLKASSRTFSELVQSVDKLPERLRPMAPQPLNLSKKGFTMLLYGDEKYVGGEDEAESSQPGGRHRVTIVSEGGRPRRMTLERNIKASIDSKL